jgi:uncharacterized repeat protein (TIGR03837 family)
VCSEWGSIDFMRKTWDIFCNVIDNYGDIGIAWRLARQLVSEHGIAVRLWVDDLEAFRRIWPAIRPEADSQQSCGVQICAWRDPFLPVEPAQVVIEAFGCALPETYLQAMSEKLPAPAWINLEYLSAESWVGAHHGLPSPHPRLPLTKYFFFPGYENGTGGLLGERDLPHRRQRFQRDAAAAFLSNLGVGSPSSAALKISLFAYENPVVGELLDAWASGNQTIICLVPEGRIVPQVASWIGLPELNPGDICRRGMLALHILPFLDQDDYDRLLWACDINFVRGEDSCVRAQWAARPMVWQAYPQADRAHLAKLDALLERYQQGLPVAASASLQALWQAWNGTERGGDIKRGWEGFLLQREVLAGHAITWNDELVANGNLAVKLIDFIENRI